MVSAGIGEARVGSTSWPQTGQSWKHGNCAVVSVCVRTCYIMILILGHVYFILHYNNIIIYFMICNVYIIYIIDCMCGERFHLNISCSSNIILIHGCKVLQNVMIDVNLIQAVVGWLRLTPATFMFFLIATLLLLHLYWSCTAISHYRWLDSFPWRLGTHWLQANLWKRCGPLLCFLIWRFWPQINNQD